MFRQVLSGSSGGTGARGRKGYHRLSRVIVSGRGTPDALIPKGARRMSASVIICQHPPSRPPSPDPGSACGRPGDAGFIRFPKKSVNCLPGRRATDPGSGAGGQPGSMSGNVIIRHHLSSCVIPAGPTPGASLTPLARQDRACAISCRACSVRRRTRLRHRPRPAPFGRIGVVFFLSARSKRGCGPEGRLESWRLIRNNILDMGRIFLRSSRSAPARANVLDTPRSRDGQ
jgi:hypothetical protein